MQTTIQTYPIADLYNEAGREGEYNVGKTKFYEILSKFKLERIPVGKEKHISAESKAFLDVYFAADDEGRAKLEAQYGGDTSAIAPQPTASMVVQQPDVTAIVEAVAKQIQFPVNPVQDLRDRLAVLRECVEYGIRLPTSELALLMGVPTTTISGRQTYSRYGFVCTNVNFKNGRSEWLIMPDGE